MPFTFGFDFVRYSVNLFARLCNCVFFLRAAVDLELLAFGTFTCGLYAVRVLLYTHT